jgi:hypothetical protein
MMLSFRSADGSWRVVRSAPKVLALAAVPLLLSSCSDRSVTGPTTADAVAARRAIENDAVFSVEPTMMDVPTYDGTGQAVHPDVVLFNTAWHGSKYWLTMTPYAASNQTLENPSILTSNDGVRVSVPAGLTNPVIPAPRNAKDYNSDPELLYEPQTRRLVLFERFVEKKKNTVNVLTSRDGVTWARTHASLSVRSHQAVSPTIAPREGAPAKMWTVNAGKAGCGAKSTSVEVRTAADPDGRFVETKWSKPAPVDLSIPGYSIWHIKARWIPEKSEYWMLISAYPNGGDGCKTDDLFYARSTDGTHWRVYETPIIRHQDREWTAAAVYRSTFLYDAASDRLDLWISARGSDGAWRMGYARARYASLLTALENNRELAPAPATAFAVKVKITGEDP